MEHVVFYPAPDGAPAFRRFSALDEAVRYVEHLRNAEGVSEVSVHTLTPVPVAFRAYYKVEVPPADMAMPAVPEQGEALDDMPAELPVEMPEAELVSAPVDSVPPAAEAAPEGEPASNGKRSLGFFAH
jgi:hypothetical protein